MKFKRTSKNSTEGIFSASSGENDYHIESKSCSLELRQLIESMREMENQLSTTLNSVEAIGLNQNKMKNSQSD